MIAEIKQMIADFEYREKALKELCDDYDAKRAAAIPADVQKALDDLADEYGPKIVGGQANLDILETNIKAFVVDAGESVKGNKVAFLFNKAKITWDSGMLEGMLALIPALKAARKEGKPHASVTGKEKF